MVALIISPAELQDSSPVVRHERSVYHKRYLRDVGLVETPVRTVDKQSLPVVMRDVRPDHLQRLVAVSQVVLSTLRQVSGTNIVCETRQQRQQNQSVAGAPAAARPAPAPNRRARKRN